MKKLLVEIIKHEKGAINKIDYIIMLIYYNI